MVDDVAPLWPSVRATREEARRGSSGISGSVGKAARSATHQAKALEYWLEERCVAALRTSTRAAAVLLNGCGVSRDGFTAYRRLKGKDGAVKGMCFDC